MGLAQVLGDRRRSAAYGGPVRVVLGGMAEIVVSMLIAPIVALALTRFALGLCFGQRIGWSAQQRSRDRLHWDEAARVLWPQTLTGLALCVWLGMMAPWALIFGAPVIVAMLGAIPIAVVTTLPGLSRWSMACGLFDIPEDRQTHARDVVTTTAAQRLTQS
jgi:membrane glycosyltransferase